MLIHRLTGLGALGLRAHVAFKYKTLPPGRTLPKTYQENWKCNPSSRAGGKKFSVIPMFRYPMLPIYMPKRYLSSCYLKLLLHILFIDAHVLRKLWESCYFTDIRSQNYHSFFLFHRAPCINILVNITALHIYIAMARIWEKYFSLSK